MRKLIQLGFILGLAGMLAAGYFYPWITHARFPSEATVVVNGGRGEQFVIRLPADLIYSATGQSGSFSGQAASLGIGPAMAPTHVAQFKLRDIRGNVIGLAARHRNELGNGIETVWLLAIPSRGSVTYAALNPSSGDIVSRVVAIGLAPGQELPATRPIDAANPAYSRAATDEFAGVGFELTETWVVSGMDDDGQLRGTIELGTIGRRSQ